MEQNKETKSAKVVFSSYITEKAGIEFSSFQIGFDNQDFECGDVITHDFRNGQSLLIKAKDNYTTIKAYTVELMHNTKWDWIPDSFIKSGVTYYKVNNKVYEYQ